MIYADDVYFFGGVAALVGAALAVVFGLATALTWWSCSDYERVTGRSTQYALSGTCYVLDGNQWVSSEEFLSRNLATHAARELKESDK